MCLYIKPFIQIKKEGIMKANLRILLFSFLLTLPLTVLAQIEPTDNNGNGFRNVSTLEHLRWISENPESWNNNFELDNDIDASDTENWNDGAGWSPIGNKDIPFRGIIEGNGFHISGLFIHRENQGNYYIGFLGNAENAIVRNFRIIDYDISGYYYVGGIIGYSESVKLENCFASGKIYSSMYYAGALVGYNTISTIENSNSSGEVQVRFESAGGLVGSNNGGTINNSFSNAEVKGRTSIGGLAGSNGGVIYDCYSEATVSGEDEIGGLVGANYGIVLTSSSSAEVSGGSHVGGLVGYNIRGEIIHSHSTSNVTGTGGYTGGLVGKNMEAYITNSYADATVSGKYMVGGLVGGNAITDMHVGQIQSTDLAGIVSRCYSISKVDSKGEDVGGLIGYNTGEVLCSFWDIEVSGAEFSAGGIGKTTAEMHNLETYIEVGWNFDFIWNIDNNYPFIDIDSTFAPQDLNGNGFKNITTLNHLRWLSENGHPVRGNFELDNSIDASETKDWDCGLGFYPIRCFEGIFEGNGYQISDLYIDRDNQAPIGLFGIVRAGEIRNLGVSNFYVRGFGGIGGLAGSNRGNITNCYSTGTAIGRYLSTGGLVGSNSGTISSCFSISELNGMSQTGGLVGSNGKSEIINSYARGTQRGFSRIGGLVGYNCWGTFTNCYSTGKIIGQYQIGGFIGYDELEGGIVNNSFWDVETSRQEKSPGGTGKSTEEMKTKSTFTDVDWDFEVIWSINPDINDGYPYLLMGNPTSVSEEQTDEQELYNFNVYPNPFAGSLNMEFDLPAEMPISIILMDNTGKTLHRIYDGAGNLGRNNHIVELTELPSGLYFILLSTDKEILTQKVISVR